MSDPARPPISDAGNGEDNPSDASPAPPDAPESKKDQIISLYLSGVDTIEDLALMTDARPSYVGTVLREEGFINGYFDLYTSTRHPMNAYSKHFAGRLGFKDEAAARESVDLIDQFHRQFARVGDRAGQHHALLMALVMFDRARWTGKEDEAEIYRRWLVSRLEAAAPEEV